MTITGSGRAAAGGDQSGGDDAPRYQTSFRRPRGGPDGESERTIDLTRVADGKVGPGVALGATTTETVTARRTDLPKKKEVVDKPKLEVKHEGSSGRRWTAGIVGTVAYLVIFLIGYEFDQSHDLTQSPAALLITAMISGLVGLGITKLIARDFDRKVAHWNFGAATLVVALLIAAQNGFQAQDVVTAAIFAAGGFWALYMIFRS